MKGTYGRLRRLLIPEAESQGLVAAAPAVPLREIFRRFWPYARPYRRFLWLNVALVVLSAAVATATIWLFKIVIDEVLVPRDFGPFLWIALAYVGLTVVGGVVSFFGDYLQTWIGERFLLSLRTDFFRHLQDLSLDFFERRRLGDVLARLTADISAIESLLITGVSNALSRGLQIGFFAAALIYLQWDLALASFVVVPLLWIASRHFSRRIKEVSREKRIRSGSISAVAEESLSNAMLVQAYNRQETEVERFERESRGSFVAEMASTRLKALFTPVVNLVVMSGSLVVLGLGVWELSQHRLSLGGLLVFMAYLGRLSSPVRGMGRLANRVYSASAAAERIIEFLDQRPAVGNRVDARPLARAAGLVEFRDVSFRYPAGAGEALADVSFEVAPGETLALVGASGAGKSTIAKLLLRFYDPASGAVLLDGHDLRELRLESLRDNVAVLLQETLVFHGTIRENIAYGRPGASDEDVVRAAEAADVHEFVAALPEGYDTVVGEKGRRLSGGQRQRIAIARAMIRDAPVLILDEPTTGIDVETGWRILEPLQRLMSGRTTIVISHNLMTARHATSIVVLEDGRVVERGAHAELLERGGIYARLHGLHHEEARPFAPEPL